MSGSAKKRRQKARRRARLGRQCHRYFEAWMAAHEKSKDALELGLFKCCLNAIANGTSHDEAYLQVYGETP